MREKTGKIIKCPNCGKERYFPKCHLDIGRKYCSKKCGYIGRGQTNTGRTHFKKGMIPWNKNKKGIHLSIKSEFKHGLIPWNAGTSKKKEENSLRYTERYYSWRSWVFKRDNFACKMCGVVGGKLNAHHIRTWSEEKDGRFDRENGITLCEKCHKLLHKKEYKNQWCCRWSPTLGDLESTHEEVWGTRKYTNLDIYSPTVFFGCYSLNDFYTIWRHKGRKCILWAGSDIRRFVAGYWLDEAGLIRIEPQVIARYISENCESFVENQIEYEKLKEFGVESKIVPSFLGDVSKFTPQKIRTDKKRYYSSVSGNDFQLYGWDKINEIARRNPDTEYHLYGNTVSWLGPENVIVHGRVPKEQMNDEVKEMTGCIRMVEFEGCSEILVKSVLWGQKPISLIDYPFLHSDNPRESLLNNLNKYDWNQNI